MSQPAARLNDQHQHGSGTGPVVGPCEPTVLIGGLPAARATDLTQCGSGTDPIMAGSPTVIIGGLQAARIGDPTDGGVLVTGDPTVLIGGLSALGRAFSAAAAQATPLICKDTCKDCGSV